MAESTGNQGTSPKLHCSTGNIQQDIDYVRRGLGVEERTSTTPGGTGATAVDSKSWADRYEEAPFAGPRTCTMLVS